MQAQLEHRPYVFQLDACAVGPADQPCTDGGVNLTVPVVDFCAQCPDANVGLSSVAFAKFAPLSDGIVPGVAWAIV